MKTNQIMRGRMTSETKEISGQTFLTTWTYNSADLPVTMSYPGGETLTYGYNAQMQLITLNGTDSYVTNATYDPAGRPETRTLGNGLTQTWNYNPWNTQGGRLASLQTGSLQSLTYAYDNVGNITQIQNLAANETHTYTYDALDRLTRWTMNGVSQETYTYDPQSGNLLTKAGMTLYYDDVNHKHAVSSTSTGNTYQHDANGNQTIRRIGSDTFTLKYDAENRLVEVKKNGTLIAEFTFDGDGKRVKSVIGTETTLFVGNYFEQKGSQITKYYPSGAMRRYTIPQNMTLEYVLPDHLGSTSMTTDNTGAKVSEIRYKPWGETRYTWTNETLTLNTSPLYQPTKYQFTGQYSYVSDFGLHFYNARWYDSSLGRFAQTDTIVSGGVQGLDRYVYVNNNPVMYTDPSGHRCVPEDECDTPHGDKITAPNNLPPLLIFTNDDGQGFTPEEIKTLEAGAKDVAKALAREINSSCALADRKTGECSLISPQEAFYDVFGGPITVRRVSDDCGCWAQNQGRTYGHYEIYVFSTTSEQELLLHPRLILHEIGHTFYWAAGGYVSGSSVGGRNGFYGPYFQWQFGLDSKEDLGTEIFADMFVGWVYGKWEIDNRRQSGLSINGEIKSAYMDKYMPLMINKAMGR